MDLKVLDIRLEHIAELISRLSRQIEINLHEIKVSSLDSSLEGLTIAQVSDLHIHSWNMDLMEHMVEVLNRLKPDIVTMTGDAICNGKRYIPDLTRLFKDINANYGKFACLGNHDHSDGDDSLRVQNLYKKSDVEILINESRKVNINGGSLFIAGADDIQLGNQDLPKMTRNIPRESTSVFLSHNPLNFRQLSEYDPDLVLAGHTHGGQLYFAALNFLYKYVLDSSYIAGLYDLAKTKLYVNRGIGTALISPVILGKKFIINTPRINSRPEITLFKLVSDK